MMPAPVKRSWMSKSLLRHCKRCNLHHLWVQLPCQWCSTDYQHLCSLAASSFWLKASHITDLTRMSGLAFNNMQWCYWLNQNGLIKFWHASLMYQVIGKGCTVIWNCCVNILQPSFAWQTSFTSLVLWIAQFECSFHQSVAWDDFWDWTALGMVEADLFPKKLPKGATGLVFILSLTKCVPRIILTICSIGSLHVSTRQTL